MIDWLSNSLIDHSRVNPSLACWCYIKSRQPQISTKSGRWRKKYSSRIQAYKNSYLCLYFPCPCMSMGIPMVILWHIHAIFMVNCDANFITPHLLQGKHYRLKLSGLHDGEGGAVGEVTADPFTDLDKYHRKSDCFLYNLLKMTYLPMVSSVKVDQ